MKWARTHAGAPIRLAFDDVSVAGFDVGNVGNVGNVGSVFYVACVRGARGLLGVLGVLAAVAIAGCRSDADVTPTADTQDAAAPAPRATGAHMETADARASGASTAAPPSAAAQGAAAVARNPELSAEDRARYKKRLSEGRRLHEKKDYQGAIKAFQDALTLSPSVRDDPRALSELGWAAFFAKDLDLAEESTMRALERATEPSLKASCYYNLGRIQEERGRTADAVASYRRSLEHRLNAGVKARLAKLDAASASAFEILGVAPMQGPYVSLEAYCDALVKGAAPAPVRCDPSPRSLGDAYRGPSRIAAPAAPYLAVRVIASSRLAGEGARADTTGMHPTSAPSNTPPEIGGGHTAYHLAVRTKIGWSVAEAAATTYNPGAFGITENVDIKELSLQSAIPDGAPELFFRSVHYRGDSNMGVNELEEYIDETLTVCGIGGSEKPSCTRPIPVSWSEHIGLISPEMDEPGTKHDLKDVKGSLEVAFLPDGRLAIKGDPGALPAALRSLPGNHVLRFP